MHPAAVPCTGNGIKRTAASALLSESTAASTTVNNNNNNNSNNNLGTSHDNSSHGHESESSPPPPEKRSFIVIESPIKLDTISSAEDLDIKVLRIQNKNLSERLIQRQRLEADLRDKIDQLQNRKAADDSKLCIVDRYWTQLDEDLRLMLERFDETINTFENVSNKENNSMAKQSSTTTTTTVATTTGPPPSGSSSSSSKTAASSQSIRNFLTKLNDWDRSELEDSLKERVKFTTQTLSKLISNYERLMKRNDLYLKELAQAQQNSTVTQASEYNSFNKEPKIAELHEENQRLNDLITKWESKHHTQGLEKKQLEDKIALLESEMKELNNKSSETEYELEKIRDKAFKLDRQLAETLIKVNNLQKMNNTLSSNENSSNNSHLLNNHCDQNGHIVFHSNSFNNLPSHSNQNSSSSRLANDKSTPSLSDKQISDMEHELEQQKELAANRLQELEKLNQENQAALRQIEKLKSDLKMIPDTVIEQSSEYKTLQTKYSFILNDNLKLRQSLDETRNLLEMSRITFQRQLEQMESEELAQQKKLGNEMMQLEEQLTQTRKENELLRIEYEQNVAANEQTGPINKEMRSLITTLQTNNKLLKSDNSRTKKRLEENQTELEKIKKQNTQLQAQIQQLQQQISSFKKETSTSDTVPAATTTSRIEAENQPSPCQQQQQQHSTTKSESSDVVKSEQPPPPPPPMVKVKKEEEKDQDSTSHKDVIIKELKEKNKRLQEYQKEMKTIIDIYSKSNAAGSKPKGSSGNMSELDEAKSEIKRLRELLDKFKSSMSSLSSSSSSGGGSSSTKIILPSSSSSNQSPSVSAATGHHHHYGHHHSHHSQTAGDEATSTPNSSSSTPSVSSNQTAVVASSSSASSSSSSSSSDYIKKIKTLEETIRELHKSLNNKKQEEGALLNDMEITGQAFEDMQEQNIRLMQQLREKDDANFKLVSERIKLENVQKILKEEKEIYVSQVTTLQEQQETQMIVSKKLEEQIQLLTQSISILEKEVVQLQQACESYRRQAIDNVLLIQELKLNTQKYLFQLKEAQQQMAEKSELLAAQTFTNKRAQEEVKLLQTKLERQKKFEMAANMDEVLKEEIKEYKEQLRCPSCKIKQKDAVLTKCFHVFCYDCLQKRYESRQRKCPKCNANFGANDFRKLYLS